VTLLLTQPCAGPNGSSVTSSNATWGNQWDTNPTVTGAGSTMTYDNAHTIHGNPTAILLHFATVATVNTAIWKASITSAAVNGYMSFYIWRSADPSVAGTRIAHQVNASASGPALQITTGGKLRIINSAGTNVGTSAASLATNAWSRIDWSVTGISGSTGTITAAFFTGANLEGNTPDETPLSSGAGAAVGGLIADARIGCAVSVTQTVAWDLRVSDVRWSDTAMPTPVGRSNYLLFAA
jgi:hypothetical protein